MQEIEYRRSTSEWSGKELTSVLIRDKGMISISTTFLHSTTVLGFLYSSSDNLGSECNLFGKRAFENFYSGEHEDDEKQGSDSWFFHQFKMQFETGILPLNEVNVFRRYH